ncbi:MAG TPA: amidase, partial [Steroidobacteraceae bacterium]|nr:amidase [Steroidobacteraceae bacterium]
SAGLLAPTIAAAAPAIATAPHATAAPPGTAAGSFDELTLGDAAAAFEAGRLSSEALTKAYLDRIQKLNLGHGDFRGLRAVIETNPRALEIARELDRERRSKGARGPLHGIPVLVKDNVETSDHMMTTAGSLALEGWYAPADAPLVARLRAAGAVILGKTNLSEWANFRSAHSSSGWSGRGGQARNPYALDRSPSGSSSGSAVAVSANLCLLAVGTETDGSIVSPASVNGIVGIKPTVGLVSRTGVIPISHSQDTAGPLARTVRDAALMLGVLCGPDAADPASVAAAARFESDYARYLDPDGLRGAKLGIARRFFADTAPMNAFLDHCVEALKRAGAEIVDPADMPMHGAASAAEQEVMLYEFKADLNMYLKRLPGSFPVRTLADLIRFNDAHADREMPIFDQELLHQAQAKGGLDEAAYQSARDTCLNATRAGGIDAVLAEHGLDAIVTLTSGPAWLIDPVNGDATDVGGASSPAAVAGYPHVTVPAGLYRGLPVGLSFFGAAFSEGKLIKLASGFEQAMKGRVAPRLLATL